MYLNISFGYVFSFQNTPVFISYDVTRELRITNSGSFILMFQYQFSARLKQIAVTLREVQKCIILLMRRLVN